MADSKKLGYIPEEEKAKITNPSAASEGMNLQKKEPAFSYVPYQQSDTVKQAQAILNQQLSQKPGQYQSPWQAQQNDIISQILNRDKFSYDVNADALYQQYADKYINQGRLAMMDTIGQAAALTGGYDNSYAQSVGQQAYQGYLQQLNDKVPELYQLALDQYNREGQELYNQFSLLGAMEDQEYGRYRDAVADWSSEANRLQGIYNAERDYDYGMWSDGRDFGYSKYVDDRNFDYSKYVDDRNYQYQQDRDKAADAQWQAEYDESVRRWNFENKVGEFAPAASTGGSGSGSGSGWLNRDGTVNVDMIQKGSKWWQNYAAKHGLDPETGQRIGGGGPQNNGVDDGFTGKTYSEAVEYMKNNGLSNASASGIMTAHEFGRSSDASKFDSYTEYLQYTVDKKLSGS